MPEYPLIFTFQDTVKGNGFLADVTLSGRALMHRDQDGCWWMDGVQPGAITESGETWIETHTQFRTMFRTYLYDTAEGAPSYEAFRDEVQRFFAAVDQEMLAAWEKAADDIRSGQVKPEPPFDAMKREPEGQRREFKVSVDRLDTTQSQTFAPAQNVLDEYLLPDAA